MSLVNTNSNISTSGEVRTAAPTATATAPQKKSLGDHASALGNQASKAASSAWSSLTGMFKSKPAAAPTAASPVVPTTTVGGNRKPKRSSHKKSHKKHPKKGMKSKTRKGRKDFITHKGDKFYNRKDKRQTKSKKGKKGKPYSRNNRK